MIEHIPPATRTPVRCEGAECTRTIPWVLYKGRWCLEGSNPCPSCARIAELNEAGNRKGLALDRAGLADKQRGWDITSPVIQGKEPAGDFMRRLKDSMGRNYGLLNCNHEAYTDVMRLLQMPDGGYGYPMQSVYLEGPVGSGKSTLAAGIAELLATPGAATYRDRDDDEMREHYPNWDTLPNSFKRSKRRIMQATEGTDVLFIDEGELMARVRLSSSLDKDPLKQIAKRHVLVLDDLGTQMTPDMSNKRREWVRDTFERLVSYRYDHDLPLIITSNIPFEVLAYGERPYGRRAASRLAEMVSAAAYLLRGPDWRQPPEATPKRRNAKPPVDRKAAAAGDNPALF